MKEQGREGRSGMMEGSFICDMFLKCGRVRKR